MPSKTTPISKLVLLEHGNNWLQRFLLGILSRDVQRLGKKKVPYDAVRQISHYFFTSDFLGVYGLAPNERADLFLKHATLVCTEINSPEQSVLLFQGTLSQMEQEVLI